MSTPGVEDGLVLPLLMLLGPLGAVPLVASLLAWVKRSRRHAAIAFAACVMGLLWGLRVAQGGDPPPTGGGGAFARTVVFLLVQAALATACVAWAGAWALPRSAFRHFGVGAAIVACVGMLGIVTSYAATA